MSSSHIEDIYPLSPMQQGMLFHTLYDSMSGVYFEQTNWTLKGELDIQAFERAWQRVVERHSALRASFVWEELDEPLQIIHRQVEIGLNQQDWCDLSENETQTRLKMLLDSDRQQNFDLSIAPLMRLWLIKTGSQTYQFIWSHHHLLLDGWSQALIFQEVFGFYKAFSAGDETILPPARPYRDYVAWLQEQDLAKADIFWRERLQGFDTPTLLGIDRKSNRAAAESFTSDESYTVVSDSLPVDLTSALQAFAHKHHLTLNTLMQGGWAILLSRYSGADDVLFGATVSGRPVDLPGADTIVGLFINTLPVRVQLSANSSVLAWLKELQTQQVELQAYEYTPLVRIQSAAGIPANQALFETLFVFENYPIDEASSQTAGRLGLDIREQTSYTQTNYPLTLAVSPGRSLGLEVGYDRHRFSDESIQRLLSNLQTLLNAIVADPHQSLATLPLLNPAERQQILLEWNHTRTSFPDTACIHHLFEDQVRQRPNAVALMFQDQEMTYAELDQRANHLAHYLQTYGIGPEQLVAVCLDRSFEMVVSLIAILKAGGAYLPLDPDYPPERLAFMLRDTQTPLILTEQPLLAQDSSLLKALALAETEPAVICIDQEAALLRQGPDQKTTLATVTAENLAYVIYTSGSTGRPKGVMLPHRGLINFTLALGQDLEVKPGRRMLQFASASFDASVGEIFIALLNGATLVLAQRDTLLSTPDLIALLQTQAVTTATLPPAILRMLNDEAAGLPDLKYVASVGEACTPDIVAHWANDCCLFNGYGPTETTIGATWGRIEQVAGDLTTLSIGKPQANIETYILDRHLQPVPIGVPGELHIAGVGVGYGYLNRPDLTAEKFIPHPFSQEIGARLYKTGDLVRYRADGNIEFLGRIDDQVKVRGFRIELGEIEAALTQHPAVQQAAVLAQPTSGKSVELVAYVVTQTETPPTNQDLRHFLQQRLPSYMVSSIFVLLAEMPLTPSGKIDRRRLPDFYQEGQSLKRAYAAPQTPQEEVLANLWSEVLNVERVGRNDDFFELGGHSLLVTQLIARAREAFQAEIPLRYLFEHSTLADFAARVQTLDQEAVLPPAPPLMPIERDGKLPLSFAQQRLWFLDQLEPGNRFYNMPLAIRLTGQLDVAALEQSLNEIIRRHESLRTHFALSNGHPVQIIAPDLELSLPLEDLSHLPPAEQETVARQLAIADIQQSFDLAHGPLLRVRLLRLDEATHWAILTTHHIVSDGWSMSVLINELGTLYPAFAKGEASPLPELPIQYADYAQWQRQWLQGEVLERQLTYWREQLAGSPPILDLPTDRPRPAVQTSAGETINFALPFDLSADIKSLSQETGATLFMTLLTAFQTLLARYSGQDDICVGSPIANRTKEEVEGLIGFFVNTLVLRTDLSGDPTFEELLARVREIALGAYAHQDLPFEMLVEALQPERDLSHTPLFQVMFVLDNTPSEQLELPELTLDQVDLEGGTATFDLTLSMSEDADGLQGMLEYNTDLFDRTTIERLIGHFQMILSAVVADPDQPISQLMLLTPPEQQQLLINWNETGVPFPDNTCIHHLFEAHAAQQPEAIAVTFQGRSLTYAQLNRQANQLAHYLQKLGVQPEVLVGLSTKRSLEMVVGILGVLKAGGAYIPLDPTYPPERLAFMLADSQISILLTQSQLVDLVPDDDSIPNYRRICLDSDWPTIAQEPDSNPSSPVTATNLAYVIYTSGSTGKPKGAMLQHRGLCNLTDVQRRAFNIRPESKILQFSPLSFDASVWETFMALRNGATLCLASQETLASGPDLVKLLQSEGVTNVTLPPSVLKVLPAEELPHLKTVIAAGEACSAELVQRWAPGRDFFNAYGPTETTVCASMYRCDENDSLSPPIGRPIDNSQLYILDRHLQPVPVGVPGELHIGGVNLARGYLNRPDLTAEKFIRHPFVADPQARLYKTGDLVRYRPDGNIEFLGRIDHQVKVRGFRIELGEIETALQQHPGLRESVVVVREDVAGDKRLVAYIVPAQEPAPTDGELRSFLRQTLPEYMLPSIFVTLTALPLSPSGKIERKTLPEPDRNRPDLTHEYVAPRDETEEKLATLCKELLGIEQVGVFDNFFELGGHSLLATQLISRLREIFQVELPLRALFENPTIAGLAEALAAAPQHEQEAAAPAITPVSRESYRVKRSTLDKTSNGSANESAQTQPKVRSQL